MVEERKEEVQGGAHSGLDEAELKLELYFYLRLQAGPT